MQIGYIRVSKSDGSQVLDLQRDAMFAAGIDPEKIYKDWVFEHLNSLDFSPYPKMA